MGNRSNCDFVPFVDQFSHSAKPLCKYFFRKMSRRSVTKMLATKNSPRSSSVSGMSSARPLAAKGFQMNTPDQENTHLDAFLAAAHRRKYPAKSTLIYAGDKSDSIYYILKGSVTVLVEDESGREIIVAYLNKGDFFGEMPLFTDDTPRSAWVKEKSRTRLNGLSAEVALVMANSSVVLSRFCPRKTD